MKCLHLRLRTRAPLLRVAELRLQLLVLLCEFPVLLLQPDKLLLCLVLGDACVCRLLPNARQLAFDGLHHRRAVLCSLQCRIYLFEFHVVCLLCKITSRVSIPRIKNALPSSTEGMKKPPTLSVSGFSER